MNRSMMQKLLLWKDSPYRKPLLFQGARQVGKTWLLKEFGRLHYKNTVYINFDMDDTAKRIFENDFSIERIITSLQLLCGHAIMPGDTLLIFDEIQEAPRAVTCLKYFCENAPEYHIAAAGSYLGVATLQGTGFPVGKTESLVLHPMDFMEFLDALGQNSFVQAIQERAWTVLKNFNEAITTYLRYYYLVGGMPEAVAAFVKERDFFKVRSIQQNLLNDFVRDFGKHPPKDIVPAIRSVWNAVPAQLAKENKRFILSKMEKHARSDNFASAIQWLCDAGLAYRLQRVSKAGMPLSAYVEENIFKLYHLDIGLLAAQSELDPQAILEGNRIFTEFKGALTEQYVYQQLLATSTLKPYYWATATNELDFLFQIGMDIVPLEVKAENNLRSRSLMCFCRKFQIPFAMRTSMIPYRKDMTDTLPMHQDDSKSEFRFLLENLPLYGISQLMPTAQSSMEASDF